MNKRRLQSLNITIILLFLLAGIIASSIALFIVAIATGMWGKVLSTPVLGLFVAVAVALFAANTVVIATLFYHRASLLRNLSLMKEFLSADADIASQEDFEKALKKSLKMKENNHNVYVAALSLFAFRGQPIANYGPTYVYAFNEIAYNAIKNNFGGKPNFIYSLSGQNIYYIAGKTSSQEEFSEELQHVLASINEQVSLQPSLPPLYALAGYLEATSDKNVYQIMKQASYAMNYKPSQRLSGDIKLFNEKMITARERYQALDGEIDRALEKKEFLIFYQAKWDVKANRFYGAEALIRWRHPQRGYLPPSVFIPAAESSGKIVDVDHYVFETVCADIEKWNKEKRRKLVVSVNLSRRTVFDPNIINYLAETVKKHNVDPSCIEIELTESIAAQFTDQIRHVIMKIQSLGFSTSMDDFGVGYSSLSSIKNISFNVVKLDKGFIDDIENSKKSSVFVASIISLIHSMNIHVIAEGVETERQVEILKSNHLDSIQGYYYSRPLERTRFEAFLEDNRFEGKEADAQ
ncbi:MAG: EAL domain-containing protein [Bacilli bacterium]|nr:EAL domain-containing protein [Bacilli bacterium]